MSQSRTIVDLTNKLRDTPPVKFLRVAHNQEGTSPIATVYYSVHDQEEKYGLRLDTAKRAFLDSTGIDSVDQVLDSLAPIIVTAISEPESIVVQQHATGFPLQSDSEIEGVFWVAGRETGQARGRLVYSAADGLTLRLSSSLSEERGFAFFATSKFPAIYAKMVDGRIATFFDCFESASSLGAGGEGPSTVVANRCLFGVHAQDPSELKFNGCHIQMVNLEDWIEHRVIQPDYEGRSGADWGLRYQAQDPIKFFVGSEQLELSIHLGYSSSSTVTSFTVRQTVTIVLRSDAPRNLDDWLTLSWRVQLLISFLVGSASPFKELQLELQLDDQPELGITCPFVSAQRTKVAEKTLPAPFMLFPWKSIEDSASLMFDRWFARTRSINVGLGAFVEVFFRPKAAREMQLIALISALEIFFFAAPEGQIRLIGGEQQQVQSLSSLADESIAFGVEADRMIKPRLLAMAHRLPDRLQGNLFEDTDRFVASLILTRNYILHGFPEGHDSALDGLDLTRTVEKLKVFFLCLLYSEIGIAWEDIAKALPRAAWVRWAMGESF